MSFGSFFAALSGLQANGSRLSVIGNNLANVNTVGFKSSRVTFHDFFAGSAFNGAGNPAQVGLGTNIASIDPIFTQGSLQTTNLLTDMSIQGRGFFVLANQDGISYSRAGNSAASSSRASRRATRRATSSPRARSARSASRTA
jgi:flagellar hook protein FlgE